MTDQKYIAEFMQREREMSAHYDALASECVNIPLRDEFLRLFQQSHHSQTELFQAGQERGLYHPEQASASQIQQVYAKYSNRQPSEGVEP